MTTFAPADISPELAQLLRQKANRPELIETGFSLDEESLARHRGHAAKHHSARTPEMQDAIAVYATLFDRSAPHFEVVNPMAAPVPESDSDRLLQWTVSKQAEWEALNRAHVESVAIRVIAAAKAATDEAIRTAVSIAESVDGLRSEFESRADQLSARMNSDREALENVARKRWEFDGIAQTQRWTNESNERRQLASESTKRDWAKVALLILIFLAEVWRSLR